MQIRVGRVYTLGSMLAVILLSGEKNQTFCKVIIYSENIIVSHIIQYVDIIIRHTCKYCTIGITHCTLY